MFRLRHVPPHYVSVRSDRYNIYTVIRTGRRGIAEPVCFRPHLTLAEVRDDAVTVVADEYVRCLQVTVEHVSRM